MNKTKIEWCDYTWNPITGCTAGCPYCYARKIAMRFDGHFKPIFHPIRLNELARLKKPSRIFVISMGDMFDPAITQNVRNKIYDAMSIASQHKYYILTKQPQNITESDRDRLYRHNQWVGVSISKKEDLWRIKTLRENTAEGQVSNRFVSFEPLLEDLGKIDLRSIWWIIIGAQTNPYIWSKKKLIERIIVAARKQQIPIFLKNNLKWPKKIQDFQK